jgi:hypothetical protein
VNADPHPEISIKRPEPPAAEPPPPDDRSLGSALFLAAIVVLELVWLVGGAYLAYRLLLN